MVHATPQEKADGFLEMVLAQLGMERQCDRGVGRGVVAFDAGPDTLTPITEEGQTMDKAPVVEWKSIEGLGMVLRIIMPDGRVGTLFYPYPRKPC